VIKPGTLRHRVKIMAPPSGLDERGQPAGGDTVFRESWPCSIVPLSGTELDVARQKVPTASLQVECWGVKGLTTAHYLLQGTRRLTIGFIDDPGQDGLAFMLTCTEEPA
jgi:head-tail adaptor